VNDVAGAHNAAYHARKPTGRRTSLIIGEPDCRMPLYTEQALKMQEDWDIRWN
jgi:hypothetical protein